MYEQTIQNLVDMAKKSFDLNSKRVEKIARLLTANIIKTDENGGLIDALGQVVENRSVYDVYVSKNGVYKTIVEAQEYINKERSLGRLKKRVLVHVENDEQKEQVELKEGNVSYHLADSFKVILDDPGLHAFVIKGSGIKIDGGLVEYASIQDGKNVAVYCEAEGCEVLNMNIKNARYPRPFAGVTYETNIQTY